MHMQYMGLDVVQIIITVILIGLCRTTDAGDGNSAIFRYNVVALDESHVSCCRDNFKKTNKFKTNVLEAINKLKL